MTIHYKCNRCEATLEAANHFILYVRSRSGGSISDTARKDADTIDASDLCSICVGLLRGQWMEQVRKLNKEAEQARIRSYDYD